jgi:hypothetical protein
VARFVTAVKTSPEVQPPSLLYNGYQVSFQKVKWLGHGIDHPPLPGIKVKKRVELYIYLKNNLTIKYPFKEIIAIYSENNMKHVTKCRLFNAVAGAIYIE